MSDPLHRLHRRRRRRHAARRAARRGRAGRSERLRRGLRARDRHGRAARDHRDDRDASPARPSSRTATGRSIRALIDAAGLPERARARAQEAFERLAIAEGKIHGIDPERVHFHEVGAIDAIGEVVGVALALESLGDRPRRSARRCRWAAGSSTPRTGGCRCPRRRRSSCCAGAPRPRRRDRAGARHADRRGAGRRARRGLRRRSRG